eukprot:213128-Pleurochrysis_carterae.AAC.2
MPCRYATTITPSRTFLLMLLVTASGNRTCKRSKVNVAWLEIRAPAPAPYACYCHQEPLLKLFLSAREDLGAATLPAQCKEIIQATEHELARDAPLPSLHT